MPRTPKEGKPNLGLRTMSRLEKEQRGVINDLTTKLEAATALADQHNKERVAALDERARARNAERDANKLRDEVLAENDQLRAQLRERELDSERMRGYLDGLEDAKPTPLVEAPRERKFGTYIDRSRMDPSAPYPGAYGNPPPRQWWERPR